MASQKSLILKISLLKYLHLLHWKSVLFLAFTLMLIKLTLFDPFSTVTLNWVGMGYLSIAVCALSAAGSLIDEIQCPRAFKHPLSLITRKTSYNLFFILNILGVTLGFYLSNLIEKPSFAILFIGASALLYLKAIYLNTYALLRPLLTSLLLGMALLSSWLFDIFPSLTTYNQHMQLFLLKILGVYIGVLGSLIFIRELVLDQLYMNIDHKNKRNTLSLVLGKKRTNGVILIFTLLTTCVILFFLLNDLYRNLIALIYVSVLILIPLILLIYHVINASHEKDYKLHLKLLNGILIFTTLSIALYQVQFLLKS